MKSFTVILVVALLAAAQAMTTEQRERMNKISNLCRAKTGATTEMIQKARSGEVVDDPKMRAQALCVAVEAKVMTATGDIDKELMTTKLNAVAGAGHEEKVKSMMEECAVKKDNAEETAMDMLMCLHKHTKDMDFHITN